MRAIAGKSTVVTVLTRTGLVPEIGISAPNVNCACIPVSFRRRQKQAVDSRAESAEEHAPLSAGQGAHFRRWPLSGIPPLSAERVAQCGMPP